jgi:cyclohexanone monooxygenase
MVVSIEQHVDWLAGCLDYARAAGHRVVEATAEAQDKWMAEVDTIAAGTLFPGTKSWYTGANVPGKPRVFSVFLGGVGTYRQICDDVAANDYVGFEFH